MKEIESQLDTTIRPIPQVIDKRLYVSDAQDVSKLTTAEREILENNPVAITQLTEGEQQSRPATAASAAAASSASEEASSGPGATATVPKHWASVIIFREFSQLYFASFWISFSPTSLADTHSYSLTHAYTQYTLLICCVPLEPPIIFLYRSSFLLWMTRGV